MRLVPKNKVLRFHQKLSILIWSEQIKLFLASLSLNCSTCPSHCFCFYFYVHCAQVVYPKRFPSKESLEFYFGLRTPSLKTKTKVSKTGYQTQTTTPATGPALPATHKTIHLSPLTSPKLESTASSPSVFVTFTPSKTFLSHPIFSPTLSPPTPCSSVPTFVS